MPTVYTTMEPWREITVSDGEYAMLMRQGLIYLGVPVPPPPTEAERAFGLIEERVNTSAAAFSLVFGG